MDRGQRAGQHFFSAKKMRDITSGIILTGITSAIFFDRRKIISVFRIGNAYFPIFCVDSSISSQPRRQNAVKKIRSIFYSHKKIFRLPYSQQVPRFPFASALAISIDMSAIVGESTCGGPFFWR